MRVYDTLQKLPTSHLLAKAWQRTPISWDNSGWERPTVWHATYWIVTVDKVVKESDHENGIFFLRLLACALRFFCIRVFTITVFPDSGILLCFRSNHIFSTIFEFFFCLVLFFMILKKLSTFKFFLKIATFFKKSQTLKNKHVRSLIHLSLVAQIISFFYLKKGNLLLVYGIS